MKKKVVTPAPPTGPIATGHFTGVGAIPGWRPQGTLDWVLLYTEGGHGRVSYGGTDRVLSVGDLVLLRPGTPHDYGQDDPRGRWAHVWVHFVPRPEFVRWLKWPEIFPGIHYLHIPESLRKDVLGMLVEMDAVAYGAHPRREELAMNSLERVLFYCDPINPLNVAMNRDLRIQKAVEDLCRNFNQPFRMNELARRCGLSRSRFTHLFRKEMGQSPARYLEVQRIHRARQMMEYTNQTLMQIADAVGFSSPYYLSSRFRRYFGKSPKAYRRPSADKSRMP